MRKYKYDNTETEEHPVDIEELKKKYPRDKK